MSGAIPVGGRQIGDGSACFVIAEVGVNHNGDVGLAHAMVDHAAAAGADAVKFQVFTPALLASELAPTAAYQKGRVPQTRQLEMLRSLALRQDAFAELKAHVESLGLIFLASVFDEEAVRLLADLDVAAIKIPSGEVTNRFLLETIGATGRSVLMSVGMATLAEVDAAIDWLGPSPRLALLHCVSSYPAALSDSNLLVIPTLRARYQVPVGWSDHTPGTIASVAAVAIGAALIEKHFTTSRELPGPDQAASLEPTDFAAMVRGIREVELALGSPTKRVVPSEVEVARVARKSLHWRHAMEPGDLVRMEDFVALRPGTGLPPSAAAQLIGRSLKVRVVSGAMVTEKEFTSSDEDPPT